MKGYKTHRKAFLRIIALTLCCFLFPIQAVSAEDSVQRLEAEDGTVQGHVKIVSTAQGSWVEGFQEAGDRVEIPFIADHSGMFDISVILASVDGGHKENPLLLDGERVAGSVVNGKDFQTCVLSYIYLTAGEHTLGLDTSWGCDLMHSTCRFL